MAIKTAAADPSALKGNERKLPYKVYPMPSEKKRFSFTWDVFKNKLGRLVFTNLLMLLFFVPALSLLFLRTLCLSGSVDLGAFGEFLGIVYFGAGNVGVGYPVSAIEPGVAEQMVIRIDLLFSLAAVVLSVFTAVGLSGGMYCVRKFLRSDEDFRFFDWFLDFFRGVGQGYPSALVCCVISFAALLGGVYCWNMASYQMAIGGNAILWWALRIIVCLACVLVVLIALWYFAIGSNYKPNLGGLWKHTFRISFAAIIQSIACLGIGVLPLLVMLLFGNFFFSLGAAWFLLLGFATIVLIFASLSDWVFDSYSDYFKVQTAIREKREMESRKEAPLTEEQKMSMLRVGGKSAYLAKAVQSFNEGKTPVVAPDTLTADAVKAVAENRAALRREAAEYAAKYADEERYITYNKLFDDREKMLQEPKKGRKISRGMLGE